MEAAPRALPEDLLADTTGISTVQDSALRLSLLQPVLVGSDSRFYIGWD